MHIFNTLKLPLNRWNYKKLGIANCYKFTRTTFSKFKMNKKTLAKDFHKKTKKKLHIITAKYCYFIILYIIVHFFFMLSGVRNVLIIP